MAGDAPDVSAVYVNADRGPVVEGIAHAMDIAHGRRDDLDVAGVEPQLGAIGRDALRVDAIVLRAFGSAQHADDAPHRVIMNRRVLAGTPDEAHDRKPLEGVAVEQV